MDGSELVEREAVMNEIPGRRRVERAAERVEGGKDFLYDAASGALFEVFLTTLSVI